MNPSAPTLAGSAVTTGCADGAAWIDYRVQVTDPPDGVVADAVLRIGSGARSVDVPLGEVTTAGVSGRVAVPQGAMAAGTSTATIRLEPQIADPLTLPVSAPECAQPAALGALAATGLPSWMPMLGIAGVVLVVAGALFRPFRRRREG